MTVTSTTISGDRYTIVSTYFTQEMRMASLMVRGTFKINILEILDKKNNYLVKETIFRF